MSITYRILKGWKYELVKSATHASDIHLLILTEYGSIMPSGLITINFGYAWDGGSGPAIDSLNSQEGSLFHDFLYQLMRENRLDHKYRDVADRLLQTILLENGMWPIRANWWYWAVKSFAKRSVEPVKEPLGKIVTT